MDDVRVVRESEHTRVICIDEPGPGGACHSYEVESPPVITEDKGRGLVHLGGVQFQNGPIHETGVNGLQNEDLLAIVIDRLEGFQSGKFACAANAAALLFVQSAVVALEERTADRKNRGVEGKSEA